MSTHLTLHEAHGLRDKDMSAAGDNPKLLTNAWKKTNENQLFTELEKDYGFSRAICRSLVHLMHEHIEANYGNLRNDSQIIYHAVSVHEPPGKSIEQLSLVSVALTISEPEDADILELKGVSGLRKHKLLRFANETYDQGGLLTQEDLALLLTTSTRTIQRDMREMREHGIEVPTPGFNPGHRTDGIPQNQDNRTLPERV